MPTKLASLILVAAIVFASSASFAEPAKKKKHAMRHWHGYGFLPGYRTPEQIAREESARGRRVNYGYYYYWPGRPRIYQGHLTDSGIGPCWTQTPIGPVWNCGK
jgi:hypothetical protein